ncbi:MAG TPA: hypothetical protein VIA18_02740 [Polyangia bacterium]|jgi:hypothetical protein|nr:hypothetical protein [Polyangia bacterium]
MKRMNRCRHCSGFMIASASHCPNCTAKGPSVLRRRVYKILGFIGLGTMSMTLMACYGSPCASDKNGCRELEPPDMSAQTDMSMPADMTQLVAHDPDAGLDSDGGK